jgi:nickel transport protein
MPLISSVALAADLQQIAKEITVRIDGPGAGGSGFIVKRENDIYTVVTNWHVVDREGEYTVKTEDGRAYAVRYSQIQQLPGADLAVMYFTSSQNYRVAELGNSDNVSLTQTIYVSGWVNPVSAAIRQPAYSLIQGQITAIQSPNDGGYALVYNTTGNYKGMSGGPVLNQDGKVIGVNGQAVSDAIQGMVGLYLGIPINTFERLQARVSPPAPRRSQSTREERLLRILTPVPVFTITNSQGSPLLVSMNDDSNSASVAGVFISKQDADNFVRHLLSQNNPYLSDVQVTPVSLAEVYQVQQQSQNNSDQPVVLDFVPSQSQVQSALEVLRENGENADRFTGVPLFLATGADNGYLTIEQDGNQIIPLFFQKEQLEKMLDSLGEKQPDLAASVQIQVVDLQGVINLLQRSEDPQLDQIVLIPPKESLEYIRSLQRQNR